METRSVSAVLILAVLGAISGALGTLALGFNIGEAPHPGLYMILAGIWFGMVIGYAVWSSGHRSLAVLVATFAGTWVAWELAVNVALQIDSHWRVLSPSHDLLRGYVTGFSAGAVGALATWTAVAISLPEARHAATAISVTLLGAALGLLLPFTNNFDTAAVLLVPWQATIAAFIASSIRERDRAGPHSLAAPI